MYKPLLRLTLGLFVLMMIVCRSIANFDASAITWSHATNSRELLEQALKSNVTFLEADVSWGNATDEPDQPNGTAIMAHPPANVSDISLEQWLDIVRKTQKGVKLDFKSDEAFDGAIAVLQKFNSSLPKNLWLNADILPGPWQATAPQVTAKSFIQECAQFESTLSPGWTTIPDFQSIKSRSRYSWQDVWLMARTLACNQDEQRNHFAGITFPVRAIFVGNSVSQLAWLLEVTSENSSLTVWSGEWDMLDVKDLLLLRRAFSLSQVYYDLPASQANDFNKIKNSVTYQPNNTFEKDLWAILSSTNVPFGCDEANYVTPGVNILYGGSDGVAVVYNKLLTFPLNITGILKPYELADYNGNYTERGGAVRLVLAANRSYWSDGDWKDSDLDRVAFTMGINNPNGSFSDCEQVWRVEAANSTSPIRVSMIGACEVDTTQGDFRLQADSSVVVGFIFTGPRAMVLEKVTVEGTVLPDTSSGTSSATLKIILVIVNALLIF